MVLQRKLFVAVFVRYQEIKIDKRMILRPFGIMNSTYTDQYFW